MFRGQAHGKVIEKNKADKCRNPDQGNLAGGEGILRSRRDTQALTSKVTKKRFLKLGDGSRTTE